MSDAAEGATKAAWAASMFDFLGPVEGLPKDLIPVGEQLLPAIACCCPCVLIAANSQIVNQTFEGSAATKCIATCCCSNPTTEFMTRRKLRFLGDIMPTGEGSDVEAVLDVLAVTCCLPCTIIQNLKEIAKRKDQIAVAAGGAAAGAIAGRLLGKKGNK